jgi:hypothetical protein
MMNALLLTAMLIGQCGPNGCPAPISYSQPVASYEWRKFNDDSYGLLYGGNQIGLYSPSRSTYWPVDTRTQTFGQPTNPPIAPPVSAQAWTGRKSVSDVPSAESPGKCLDHKHMT